MNRNLNARLRGATTVALLLLCIPAAALADGPQKRLAVLELELGSGVNKDEVDRTLFSDLARSAVKQRVPGLFVMTRENIETLLENNGKTLTDCSGECEIDVGRKLGADYIISGRIARAGKSLFLTLSLHSTADGQLLESEKAKGDDAGALADATDQALARLLIPLTTAAAPKPNEVAIAPARRAAEHISAAPAPSMSGDATGTYQGSMSDSSGPGTTMWNLTQTGSDVSGKVVCMTPLGSVAIRGDLTGSIANGVLAFRILVPKGGFTSVPSCVANLTGFATLDAAGLAGTYSGKASCAPPFTDGHLDLHKQ